MNLRDRPYLDVEVVEVKKEKKEWTPDYCPCCGQRTTKRKGNWVNGENIDKIKFPCVVSFNHFGRKCYGMINKDFKDDLDTISYNLVEIGKQDICVNAIWDYNSLEELFGNKDNDIHIEKAKIVIFKEIH